MSLRDEVALCACAVAKFALAFVTLEPRNVTMIAASSGKISGQLMDVIYGVLSIAELIYESSLLHLIIVLFLI